MYEPHLLDFVSFWCIFCMVSFTRIMRIAGAGFGVLHAIQLIGHEARLLYYNSLNVLTQRVVFLLPRQAVSDVLSVI